MANLDLQDRCNLADAHSNLRELLGAKKLWKVLILDNDNAFVNRVCCYVLEHSLIVSDFTIDNISSPEIDFIASWTDVLLGAFRNVRKILIPRSTFLTSGLFVTNTPYLLELQLCSCPNISASTLLQGFLCAQPRHLKVLDLTGVPGLTEPSAVQIATSCATLEKLDLSGYWGPLLCVSCVWKVLKQCCALKWLDCCPYIPSAVQCVELIEEYGALAKRQASFGPFMSHAISIDEDMD